MASELIIGLTGGIGSGKSTVATMWLELGAHLVDTDAIARSLTLAGGAAMPAVERAFGPAMVAADGSLDRAAMRALVFADPDARLRLEAILHPLIAVACARQAALADGRTLVYDVPLLTESQGLRPWRSRVQRVLVVDCDEATQRRRVAQRPGWTEEAAGRVIATQASRQARRAIADAVIHNQDLTLPALQLQVTTLARLWGLLPG